MLKKLQERWKVNAVDLVLVLATFAIGGSLCGWLARKILLILELEKGVFWVVCYIITMTLLWPLCVIVISIPLGQYRFFTNYLRKIWKKMSGKKPAKIAVFASGAGSNTGKIIEYFNQRSKKHIAVVSLIVCNKPGAGVIKIAEQHRIPVLLVEKQKFSEGAYLEQLQKEKIDLVVLAGFLWQLPESLIKAFPKRIINIHPALLPGYGGKGMYGDHVHRAVIANKEKTSGISVHYADELYDHGELIAQETCPVDATDDASSLAVKIHQLEHEHYPRIIEEVLQKQNRR